MLDHIIIEVTRTSDNLQDYVQIRSPAAMPVNIVLVADRIDVNDRRTLTAAEAFAQAAAMVDELRPNLIGQASQRCQQVSRKLHKLAEGA